MTTIDQHREALRTIGLTDQQIDDALTVMDARAKTPYVDPHDLPPGAPHPYADTTSHTPYGAHALAEAGLPDAAAPPVWKCETPPSVFLMSLNGFDEIAIASRYGAPILALRDDPIAGGRALAFVHMRRTGSTDTIAYEASMNLTMQEVMTYFAPEPKPTSAEGNDSTA